MVTKNEGFREINIKHARKVLNEVICKRGDLEDYQKVNLICNTLFTEKREMTDEEVKEVLRDYSKGWRT